jgi:hypothetical protein
VSDGSLAHAEILKLRDKDVHRCLQRRGIAPNLAEQQAALHSGKHGQRHAIDVKSGRQLPLLGNRGQTVSKQTFPLCERAGQPRPRQRVGI